MFEYQATVLRVVDGDTVDLECQLGFNVSIRQRFRLAGINCPERGEIGWSKATVRLTEMLAHGLYRIETQKTDKYGRWLVTLYDIEGININRKLLDEGFAVPYSGGARI